MKPVKKTMATIEDVIASKDPEVIKKRRSTIQRWTTGVRNNLDRLLVKTAGKFDHSQIKRLEVHDDHTSLKKHYENFQVIHGAYMEYRPEGKDSTEEETLVLQDEKHYQEVRGKIFESLKLIEDYEESYKSYKASQPDPELARREAEEKSTKEALAKLLKEEEALQKRETEAAGQAEEERNKKELRAKVVESEVVFKKSVGMYQTAKKYAEEMTRFARELNKEEVVGQVMQFAHVRSLPTYETKNRVLDRLKVATEAAGRLRDAIKAESGIEEAMRKDTFDEVAEE